MDSSNLINSCRHPRTIRNRYTGEELLVPCGKCYNCLIRKSAHREQLCKQEESSNKYCAFITLDYAEEFVPKAMVVDHTAISNGVIRHAIELYDVTERPLYNHGSISGYSHFSNYCQLITSLDGVASSASAFRDFYSKSDITSKLHAKLPYKIIRYIRKKDIQNYLKRVRFQVSKKTGEKLRFFVVSEYGPRTFRPHFHLLLYFNDIATLSVLQRICSNAWKYGNIRYSISNGGATSYVAGYVNSSVVLPDFLANREIAPFNLHSKFFGKMLYYPLRSSIYSNVKQSLNGSTYRIGTAFFKLFRQTEITTYFFPKVYNFSTQSRNDLLALYQSFDCWQSTWKSDSVRNIALNLLLHQYDYRVRMFLRKLDIFPYLNSDRYSELANSITIPRPSKFYFNVLHFNYRLADLDMQVIHRIESCLYTSKHFLSFCCGSDYSPTVMVDKIITFYRSSSLLLLSNQYTCMQSYYDSTGSIDYSIFYPLSFTNSAYQRVYDTNIFVQSDNLLKTQFILNSIKHKEYNDINFRFVGVLNNN